jgi:hypothetical protein
MGTALHTSFSWRCCVTASLPLTGVDSVIQLDSRTTALIFLGVMGFLGFIGIFVVLPIIARFSLAIEAFSLLSEGIGEYFGRPRIVMFGCLIIGMLCIGCCCITVALGGALLTCSTSTPSQFCRLIGQ